MPRSREVDPELDQVVVLRGLSWEQYDEIDQARGPDAPQPRLAYLDGELEIITTGRMHEYRKSGKQTRAVRAYRRSLRRPGK